LPACEEFRVSIKEIVGILLVPGELTTDRKGRLRDIARIVARNEGTIRLLTVRRLQESKKALQRLSPAAIVSLRSGGGRETGAARG